jgi:hypothetical protein
MENVPRYGASRSDHRSSDRESIADHDHPEDVSLLKLVQIIGRDEAFLALGRDAASRHAFAAEKASGSPPDNDPSQYDRPEYDRPEYDQGDYDQLEFDADDPTADPNLETPPQGTFSNPAYLDGDDQGARRGHAVGVRRFKHNVARSTGAPQLGQVLSELARLVGRIDSFLAAGSHPTASHDPGRGEPGFNRCERRMGGPPAASDGVDDGIVDDGEDQDIEMPVPSRHDRLTNDTDDPGLRLYAPSHKRRAAFVIARTDQTDSHYGGATRSADDRSGAARDRARGHAPRQSWPTDGTNNDDTRRRRLPIDAPPQRRGGRLLTATAILAFTATAALYGYRTWIDPGSSHPGPIAAVAAPVAATTSDSLDPPAVDAPANSGVSPSANRVWSDLTGLLAPGTMLDSAPSASHISVGKSAVAVPAPRPQRPEGRALRSPTARVPAHPVSLSPIADEAASGSANVVPPCEAGATRPGC